MTKRNSFTREFKLEAVRLLEQGDKNASVLARELGVPRNRLYKWREEIKTHDAAAFPSKCGRLHGDFTLRYFVALVLMLCSTWSAAQSFPTVDAYVEHITHGQSGVMTTQTIADDRVYGAVQWSSPDNVTETYLASVFILEKLEDNSFREVVRSNPSGGFSASAIETLDGAEAQSSSRFFVRLHSFTPLGNITYRFALIDEVWRLSGRDERFDAVGDSRVERSTNFLTGLAIEKSFRRNKLVSTKSKKTKYPKFPLTDFKFFDENHEAPVTSVWRSSVAHSVREGRAKSGVDEKGDSSRRVQ